MSLKERLVYFCLYSLTLSNRSILFQRGKEAAEVTGPNGENVQGVYIIQLRYPMNFNGIFTLFYLLSIIISVPFQATILVAVVVEIPLVVTMIVSVAELKPMVKKTLMILQTAVQLSAAVVATLVVNAMIPTMKLTMAPAQLHLPKARTMMLIKERTAPMASKLINPRKLLVMQSKVIKLLRKIASLLLLLQVLERRILPQMSLLLLERRLQLQVLQLMAKLLQVPLALRLLNLLP